LEEILTHSLLRYRSWFEAYLKTLQLLIGGPLKAEDLHIAVIVRGPSKQSTYALQWLLGASLKVENLHIAVIVGASFESRVLSHDQLRSIFWVDNKFSEKRRKITRETPREGARFPWNTPLIISHTMTFTNIVC